VPYTWIYCLCHEDEPEYYHPLSPSDWDFPCSDTFRGYSYQYCGQVDPGEVRTNNVQTEEHIVNRYVVLNFGKLERDEIHRQGVLLSELQERINRIDKKKIKGKY